MDTLKKAVLDFDTSGDTAEGFEQINASTKAIPFLRVIQKLSPELDENDAKYLVGAKEGDFFNTVTKDLIGKEFACIVLHFDRIFIEWKPNRGGFVGYHTEENALRIAVDRTFGKWKTEEGNLLQENYVYMLLVEGFEKEGPCVLSLSSSAIKVAKEWNRLMTTHVMDDGKKALPYYLVWKVKSEYQKNDKGTWYQGAFSFLRYINAEQHLVAKEERLALPSRQVDYAQLESHSEEEKTAF
jgi:hypothetical protein